MGSVRGRVPGPALGRGGCAVYRGGMRTFGRWVLVAGLAGGCGDPSGPNSGTGTAGTSTDTTDSESTGATTGKSTGTPTTGSGSTGATSGGGVCAGKACGTSCTPAVCPEADCSGYACSEEGACLAFYTFACDSQIAACEGLACGAECVDPFCKEGEGACAPAFCDRDGRCVPIGWFEMKPCEGSSSSG